jgi:hypothetical protein
VQSIKNKVEKRGVFFTLEKVDVRKPRLPRNSPQTHHVFTTICSKKSWKLPAKQHKLHSKLKSSPEVELIDFWND